MKKLNKLNINPAKIIKAEELKELKGGWTGDCAVYRDGHYAGLEEVTCPDTWNTWQCDTYCSYVQHADYCVCNFGY